MAKRKRQIVSLDSVNTNNKDLPVPERQAPGDGVYMSFTVELLKLGMQTNRNDPDSMLDAFQKYMQLAEEKGYRIGEMNAYLAMGITKETARAWETGRTRADDDRFAKLIRMVKSVCSAYREQLMLNNMIAAPTGIWWQKVHDGFSENAVQADQIADDQREKTAEEIRQKYKELMFIEGDTDTDK